MANSQHLAIIKQGVNVWNEWRKQNPEVKPDLRKAELRGYDFHEIDLHDGDLDSADFYRTDFSEANLCNANLHMAHLYRANFYKANLTDAIIRGADLVRAKLIETNLQNTDLRWVKLGEANLRHANLTGSAVYAISAWEVTLDDTTEQRDLAITPDGTHTITVDRLEIAQFIHMLLNYKKLRDVLNSFMERGVLLLGRFKDGGIELLQSIANELRKQGYLPMIFDFDRPDTGSYTETVQTLASLSKFVIVELSGPSVPQELYATVPHFKIPYVPILNENHHSYALAEDLLEYPWFLPSVRFSNQEELLAKLSTRVIQPALKNIQKRQEELEEKRQPSNPQVASEPKGEKDMEITDDYMAGLPFQSFHKSVVTRARPLMEDDYKRLNGTIQTLEGPATFQPGDYLARGAKNEEWPVSKEHFDQVYQRVAPADADGFAIYLAKDIREAHQMDKDFTVKRKNGDILSGKKGDYLVRSDGNVRVVQRDIFENTHEPV